MYRWHVRAVIIVADDEGSFLEVEIRTSDVRTFDNAFLQSDQTDRSELLDVWDLRYTIIIKPHFRQETSTDFPKLGEIGLSKF